MALKQKPLVTLDTREFHQSARKHYGQDWPKAIVRAARQLAELGGDAAKVRTRTAFRLRSDYVLRGIRTAPSTPSQERAAIASLKRHHDFTAAVYLRPASVPERSLQFMADHEEGKYRAAQDRFIAVPTPVLKQKAFRTARGRVRKRWKPETLLKRFHAAGSRFTGDTTTNKGRTLGPRKKRLPGAPFIIRTKAGDPAIARRKIRVSDKRAKHLEILYIMKRRVDIRKHWGFRRSIETAVLGNYVKVFTRNSRRLPNYD